MQKIPAGKFAGKKNSEDVYQKLKNKSIYLEQELLLFRKKIDDPKANKLIESNQLLNLIDFNINHMNDHIVQKLSNQ